MNEEQNKQTLLVVDQDKALEFYFDSLLLSDDAQLEEQSSVENNTEIESEIDNICTDEYKVTAKSKKQVTETPVSELLRIAQKKKVISPGPLSPKPRDLEFRAVRSNEQRSIAASIVFTEKDKDGHIIEQVLKPRSQKQKIKVMAEETNPAEKTSAKKNRSQQRNIPKPESIQPQKICDVVDKHSIEKPKIIANDATILSQTQTTQASQTIQKPIEIKDAPELDLSLFLPKIQTLSDTEIKEQISALSQASASQAQLESDLARVAKLEQELQQKIKLQEQSNALAGKTLNAPAWAESGFQVLLFSIAGLKLAVPLNELNGILEWGDDYVSELPGHASWYLGLIRNQGINVPVVDTLQQVVPKNRWPEHYVENQSFKHIILIDNSRWGLACESVIEVISLQADSVKWRSSRTKRRWLLGTVIDQMCALLDTSEFSAMLRTGDDSLLTE
ncbi:MAG: chemotaxis protein CheW [gamma proteobacterium symbiont of Taylorina sp.]|nr:chemotaxis protein CheW [gamma proteobacterium symbiont of Taylorina sp.]